MLARDLSEKIEAAIVRHCQSFSKGQGHCDLARDGRQLEVKIAKGSGLTINQSKQIAGESYIVVNYNASIQVVKVCVLWKARDELFSPRKSNTNARSPLLTPARPRCAMSPSPPLLQQLVDALKVLATLMQRLQLAAHEQATDAENALTATERAVAVGSTWTTTTSKVRNGRWPISWRTR